MTPGFAPGTRHPWTAGGLRKQVWVGVPALAHVSDVALSLG